MRSYYKFKKLLKTPIWGTESWQLSGVPGNESIVLNDGSIVGDLQSLTLNQLVSELKDQLVGKGNYQRFGNEFPLLIKFIDARKDLSIQVHPNDEVAHRHGKPRGKTEMWYVMDSAPDAKLYNGLAKQLTPKDYKQMVADGTICDALAQYEVKEGDCFFIPLDASIPSVLDASSPRFSRRAMSPIASMTINAATKTGIYANFIHKKPRKASITPCSTTTEHSMSQ